MVYRADTKLMVWGSDIEPGTINQAARTSRLPFVKGYVALMPDAHVGIGSTVGSVIPTQGAIIPSAIGVDIGCGMVATLTSLHSRELPDSLGELMSKIEQEIPAGVGKGHAEPVKGWDHKLSHRSPWTPLTDKQLNTCGVQFGSLGSGNHFVEICLDQDERVWTVLHSGSRGIGNQIATKHIANAKGVMKEYFITLEDPDLAYFVEGTDEFEFYINDMLWAQDYAMQSRAMMNEAVVKSLFDACGLGYKDPWIKSGGIVKVINCHHNFTQKEQIFKGGPYLWITRKGAIKAAGGGWGIIPGSMGTATYIVQGLGNPASFNSCSHGAGRKMSRTQARHELSTESLTDMMKGQTWNDKAATQLVDEHPLAYKEIDQVMADQADLCEIKYKLTSVLNFKGTK
jgi:tRNA-splicing ligase RtcB (3'-phosphate/5'-hydroxy nucleic acid ligase)